MSHGNILLIEDDYFIAEDFANIIKENNFTLLGVFSSYKEIEAYNNSQPIDLVLADINLNQDKDGIDCCLLIAQRNKNTKFAFITSFYDINTLKKASILNYIGYIPKPYKPSDIFVILETYKNKYSNNFFLSENSKMNHIILNNDFFLVLIIKLYIKKIKLFHLDIFKRNCLNYF